MRLLFVLLPLVLFQRISETDRSTSGCGKSTSYGMDGSVKDVEVVGVPGMPDSALHRSAMDSVDILYWTHNAKTKQDNVLIRFSLREHWEHRESAQMNQLIDINYDNYDIQFHCFLLLQLGTWEIHLQIYSRYYICTQN